jgi:hypothetical protein
MFAEDVELQDLLTGNILRGVLDPLTKGNKSTDYKYRPFDYLPSSSRRLLEDAHDRQDRQQDNTSLGGFGAGILQTALPLILKRLLDTGGEPESAGIYGQIGAL